MSVHISRKEAERLGLDVPAKTTKRVASGPYRTTCATCSETFTTAAAEDRHFAATNHHRYVVVFEAIG